MQSPFDTKNRLAAALDRFALSLALLTASVAYFFFLWRSGLPSLVAGAGLFALILLSLSLLERRTLRLRERLLRERVGGAIYLEDLLLLPGKQACDAVTRLLCQALPAEQTPGGLMCYEGELWLIRCTQCLSGTASGPGDVLAAHRARIESGAARCALACTTGFSAEAIRAAEWVDPPIRLIPGRQLASVAGRLFPATDEDIAEHARRRKTPFSRVRIRSLAFAPHKEKRYLLCSFLLLVLYLSSGAYAPLCFMVVSFLLALGCHRENKMRFTL